MNHFAACRMAQGTLVVTFLSIIFNGQAHGQNIVKGQTGAAHENAPVFIENLGQFDKRVRFQIKMGDKTAWLTESGIVFEVIRAASRDQDPSLPEPGRLRADSGIVKSPVQALERFVFAEDFANSGRCVAAEPKSELNSTYNYFPSGDPSSWHTNVHAYGEVTCRDVWPGIDLRLYASGSDLEQEFVVQPDGDPDRVQISYRGIENLNVSANGSLEINTRLGRLLETPPIIYQQITDNHVPVDGAFKITAENSYSFDLRNYRRGYSVVIDPTLLYSTFLGGSLNNELSGMSVDSTGDTFLAGSTTSQDFPMTIGTAPIGETSFVTKLNSTGNGLVYSTFLGGTDFSFPVPPASGGVAIDRNGRAYVTGNGYNIPSTPNAFSSCGSFNSNFLAVLSPAADQLVYSTCLPGSTPVGIALDTQGRAVLAGSGGCGIATTSNAFQSICPANPAAAVNAGFVMIVDPALSGTASLAYASYLGDPSQLLSTSIGGFAVDGFGKVYVTGQVSSDTYSAGQFPTTPGAFRTALEPCTPKPSSRYPFSWNRCQWPYVAKLDPAVAGESSLIYSTYLGYVGQTTMTGDGIPLQIPLNMAIAVDGSGSAFVTGGADSAYPTTPGAFQTNGSGTYITKLNPGGSGAVYSTFLPNTSFPYGSGAPLNFMPAISVDASGKAYVTGSANASNFPVTPDAVQSSLADTSGDAFLTVINPAGSGLVYSSYIGGGGADQALAVAVDQTGDVYIAGQTASFNFPISAGPFQPTLIGSGDIFVTKFPLGTTQTLAVTSIAPSFGGNTGTTSPQIFGTGFHAGATAQLNCPSTMTATNVTVGPGGRMINATFNLTGTSPGKCDVVVTDPSGSSATLPQAFTVQEGGAASIRVYLTGLEHRRVPPEIASGPADAFVSTTISNTGNSDSAGGVLVFPLNSGFNLTSISDGSGTSGTAVGSGAATPPATASSPTSGDGETVVLNLPNLPAGQSEVVSSTASTVASAAACSVLWGPVCLVQDVASTISCIVHDIAQDPGACAAAEAWCAAAATCVAASLPTDIYTLGSATTICFPLIQACIIAASSPPCVVSECIQNGSSCTSSVLQCVVPTDPNALVGPPGIGGHRWVPGAQAQTYVASFSNIPTAPIPAQQVIVSQALGPNVNLSSLNLINITIPNGADNVQAAIPAGAFNPALGANEFTTNIDLRPAQSLIVNVDATLNPATATLTWTLTSVDPTTGQPPLNPLIGFLPAGAEANVSVSVTPKQGLATGAQISEQASITFVGNSPMSTPTWTNTIDNTEPVSSVSALATTQTTSCFRPQWVASDVGSGVQGTSIFVSDNGGPYAPWLRNTTAASAVYNGVAGHAYAFYSQSTDLVGNVEAAHPAPDAVTSVPPGASCNGRPTVAGLVASKSLTGTTETLTLQLTNNGNGNAQNIKLNSIAFRTLIGTGPVTLISPATPSSVGNLAAGASTTTTLMINVPGTVKEFSITEAGAVQDAAGTSYNFSIAQAVFP